MSNRKADPRLRQILNRLKGCRPDRPRVKGTATISARVIRKDGTVEDLGVIYRQGGERSGKS